MADAGLCRFGHGRDRLLFLILKLRTHGRSPDCADGRLSPAPYCAASWPGAPVTFGENSTCFLVIVTIGYCCPVHRGAYLMRRHKGGTGCGTCGCGFTRTMSSGGARNNLVGALGRRLVRPPYKPRRRKTAWRAARRGVHPLMHPRPGSHPGNPERSPGSRLVARHSPHFSRARKSKEYGRPPTPAQE